MRQRRNLEAVPDLVDEPGALRDEEHDQVGTVDVQILLSWFFETSGPDVALDLRRAA